MNTKSNYQLAKEEVEAIINKGLDWDIEEIASHYNVPEHKVARWIKEAFKAAQRTSYSCR